MKVLITRSADYLDEANHDFLTKIFAVEFFQCSYLELLSPLVRYNFVP